MKTKRIQGYNIVYDGDGPIPAIITGPAEIYISTFTEELKQECTLFGVNYPWRRKPQDVIDPAYRPNGWSNMADVVDYYHHVAKLFCAYLNKERCLAIGPSTLAALADQLALKDPDFISGACMLSPISLIEMSRAGLTEAVMEEYGIDGDPFLSFDSSKIETNRVESDFYYYLDTLREDSDKDFTNETLLRPKWIELWEEYSDNVETISFLLNVLFNYQLGTAKTHVLMVSGEKDGRYPVDLAKSLNLSEYYKHIIMPGGHATHFEYQNEFTDVFIAWLTEIGLKKLEPRVTQRTKDLRKTYERLEQEIKSRKRTEEHLRQSEAHFRTLSSMAPVGIFRMDPYGRSLYINERFRQITGLGNSVINHEDWISRVHPEDQSRIKEKFYHCIQNNNLFDAEYRFLHANGMVVWVQGHVVPEISNEGAVSGLIGTLTDITTQRNIEEELRQHQSELAHFSRINMAGEMVSGLAHEINQPLSSIVQFVGGTIACLSKMNISDDILEALYDIEGEAERAGKIIGRLRSFVKKEGIQKNWSSIDNIIENTLSIMHHDLSAAEIKLDVNAPSDLPLVYVDNIQIEQVFVNILRNSIDALQDVPSGLRSISIVVLPCDSGLQVKITDTGLGMTEETLKSLFNPFYTTKSQGMGIGLSISNTIVRAHGGLLTVESEVGSGTTLTLELVTEDAPSFLESPTRGALNA